MGAEKITITFKNGDQKKVDKGTSLSSLCLLNDDILAAYLNGSLCHLDQKIYSDCFIEWIKNNEEAGARVYQRSLCLLLFTALKELFAQKNVKIVECTLYQVQKQTKFIAIIQKKIQSLVEI